MGDVPDEWLEYLICERFHQLPSTVEREAARDIYRLLTIMTVEQEVREARAKERA